MLNENSSWAGWFPVLFYTTAFIGDLHKASSTLPSTDPDLDAEATRLGTRAMFYSSILSVVGNVVLPFVVADSAHSRRTSLQVNANAWSRFIGRMRVSLATLWAVSHLVFAVCMFATL